MPIVTDSYNLSLTQNDRILKVRCSQSDSGRVVNFSLYNHGNIFTIPTGISASIAGVKANGGIFTKQCSISNNQVVVTLDTTITNVVGVCVAEIVLTNTSGERFGTSNFIINVEQNPLLWGKVQVSEEAPIDYIADFVNALESLNARVNNILTPSGEASLSEVVDARLSVLNPSSAYSTLRDRINADVNTLSTNKADKSTTYTKTEVDNLLDNVTIDIDDELDETSENPVQNKVIYQEVSEIKADLDAIEPGLSNEAKEALLACFAHVAWIDGNGVTYYDALETALSIGEVVSISAQFSQGNAIISETDMLTDLMPFLIVTAVYGNGTMKQVTKYVLNGSLRAGTSTITVEYGEKSTSFTVNVTTVPSGYTAKNYIVADATQYMYTQIPETAAENWWFRTKEKRTDYDNRYGHVFSSFHFYTPYLFAYGTSANCRLNFNRFESGSVQNYAEKSWETDIDYVIESYKNGNDIFLNGIWGASVQKGTTLDENASFVLLAYPSDGTAPAERFRFKGFLYYIKAFNENNVKVHDFIPCVNQSNVVGLYDLVDNTFYAPNAGTLVAG